MECVMKANSQYFSTPKVAKTEDFNARKVCESKVNRIIEFMRASEKDGFVLGVSGGVDSTLAGKLAAIACEKMTLNGERAKLYALRLPCNTQADEDDAQDALRFISAKAMATIDIGQATQSIHDACVKALGSVAVEEGREDSDRNKGNMKARMRMIAQYYVASATNTCVLGTENACEAMVGFFTKWGDSATDVNVLGDLNKRQVRECLRHLNAPKALCDKIATADLEDDNPGLSDEKAIGVPYNSIDDFLEGKKIAPEEAETILDMFMSSRHKLAPVEL